jgi:ribose transport system substrate-binding protein
MKTLLSVLALALVSTAFAAEKIAVIPKGTTHSHWKSVEAGAKKAGQELGVEIIWKGPLKEDDRAQQIALVQQFVSSGVSAIVLAPLDDTALRGPVKSAADRKIPVVIFDRQSARRHLGWRRAGSAPRRQRQSGAAPLCGRLGEHR